MSFEFLKQGRVWLEDLETSNFYLLHTTKDITFSQTFKQAEVAKKTLHNLDKIIEGSSITQANPANFSFTMYLVEEAIEYQHFPLDLLIQSDPNNLGRYLKRFNLYFVYADYSPQVYYKIENCFFASGSFKIPRNGIMTVELSGEGSKLTRNTGSPGSIYAGYDATPTYAISKEFNVWLGGTSASDKLDNVLGASFEIQNSTNWNKNTTVNASLQVTDSSNTIYPQDFTLTNRSVSGNIQQYIDETKTQSKDNVLTWAENTTVHIKAGLVSSNYQLQITMDGNASYTNRASFGEVFTQSYDFRLMDNVSNWSNLINYD